eukprot:419175-Prorocentrum_minimum.AAC.1
MSCWRRPVDHPHLSVPFSSSSLLTQCRVGVVLAQTRGHLKHPAVPFEDGREGRVSSVAFRVAAQEVLHLRWSLERSAGANSRVQGIAAVEQVTCRHLPSLTVTYRHLPALTVTYRHLLSLTVTYRHLPSLTVTYCHLPSHAGTYCHLPSLIVTYRHLPALTVTYCHLLSLTVTYCHLPALTVAYCHLLSLTVTYRRLPSLT